MADEKISGPQELERGVEALESQVREQIARTRNGATIMLVFGIVIVLLIGTSLLVYGGMMRDLMVPENLVQTMDGLLGPDEAVIEGIGTLKESTKKKMPTYVADARKALLRAMPDVRKGIEKRVAEKVDEFGLKFDAKVDQLFKDLVAQNRKHLLAFVEAAASDDDSRVLEADLTLALEELIGSDLDKVMVKFDRKMILVESKLANLSGAKLSKDEEFEREAIVKMLLWIDGLFTPEVVLDATPPTT
jgi:hypothetical protein